MTDELEAACERALMRRAGLIVVSDDDWNGHPTSEFEDDEILATAYLADRDRRKREAEERALPVKPSDVNCLRSLGFEWNGNYWVIADAAWITVSGHLHVSSRKVSDNPNRGQVLDLLSALQITIPQKSEVPCGE